MKHFLFSLLWGAGIVMLSAQAPTFQIQDSSTTPTLQVMMDSVFALTDLSGISSGILADWGFQYVPIEWYEGTLQAYNKLYYETWHGLYASMYTAAMDFPALLTEHPFHKTFLLISGKYSSVT
jgi:hypothetical protein